MAIPSTRDRALDAALALVGDQGIRALTHARVDERAELPKGSTSNWFRTRDALVAGVITHLAERERDDMSENELPPITTSRDLADALTGMIAIETGAFAWRSRARFALFLEGSGNPELLKPLLNQRAIFVDWITSLLGQVGAPSPESAARMLMATADGLVLHRVTVDPDAPIGPAIERAVAACLS